LRNKPSRPFTLKIEIKERFHDFKRQSSSLSFKNPKLTITGATAEDIDVHRRQSCCLATFENFKQFTKKRKINTMANSHHYI
jgi:hypothetical protein